MIIDINKDAIKDKNPMWFSPIHTPDMWKKTTLTAYDLAAGAFLALCLNGLSYDRRAEIRKLLSNRLNLDIIALDEETKSRFKEVISLLSGDLTCYKNSQAKKILRQIKNNLSKQKTYSYPQLTNNQKEAIIAEALKTEDGRLAISQAMVEPIRRQLDYSSIGRKLLLVDELPQGALARYERDVEKILIPTFELASNPQVQLSDIKARRFHIVDKHTIGELKYIARI